MGHAYGIRPSSEFEILNFKGWSKFHVNSFIGTRVMKIFMYKKFDRKSEKWKDFHAKFVQYPWNKASLVYQIIHKWWAYSFYCFWVIQI